MIRPQEGPQTAFLATPADIALYGGAAGGGKTWALLLEPVRHINNPNFGAVTFRRTSPQITNQGGMWDESAKIYPYLNAKPNQTHLRWTFESGSRVRFAHMQYLDNRFDWQGSQITLIGFDELTHFEAVQFWYMLSRNRSMCGVKPYVRATTNPDADSWVAELVAWWINQETGYPIPERSGVLRYFFRHEEQLDWADHPEELYERHPEIVTIARDSKRNPRELIRSFTFIPAKLDDNLALKHNDPSYLANLLALPLVEQERLLGGNWKIQAAAGKVFNRGWFELVDAVPAGGISCRFWDFAATERKLKGDDPDYTAGVKIRLVQGIWYVEDCIDVQVNPAEVERLLINTAHQDTEQARLAGARYRVRWELEPGASSRMNAKRLTRDLAGLNAKAVPPSGDKLERAKALSAQAYAGNVKLLKGPWNERWLTHMHHQPDWDHDDIMDASSGAFNELTRPEVTVGRSPVAGYRG